MEGEDKKIKRRGRGGGEMVKEVNGGEGARRDDKRGVGEQSSVKNTRTKKHNHRKLPASQIPTLDQYAAHVALGHTCKS